VDGSFIGFLSAAHDMILRLRSSRSRPANRINVGRKRMIEIFRPRARFVFSIAVAVASIAAAPSQAGVKKVLTIAMDGVRPDALAAANTPHIDSLLDGTFFGTGAPSGIFAMNAQAEHLTFSGPGWGAYMTGLHVDRHGADTNGFENVVPGTTDWFTPLEAFNPNLHTHRVLTWNIANTSIPSGADTAENFEYDQNGDQLMTNRVVQWMQDPATDAVMMFYSDTDTAGHTCGFSPTAGCYIAQIQDVDSQIGQIMTAMAARLNFANEDWLVIMTSDHGGLGTGHAGGLPEQRTIPYIAAGRLATTVLPQANPRQVDVAATVLTYFGAPIPSNYDGHAVGLTPAGPAPAGFGHNLIFNGDAEYNRGFNSNSTQQYAAGWDDPGPGGITLVNYLAGNGFPAPSDPGPPNRGNNFFSGGTNAVSTMTQRLDVSNLAGSIDGGGVNFNLSGWIGGYSSQNDTATVIAHFLNAANSEIGSAQIAPVTAADRGNLTKLLFRQQLGLVPTLTRSINIELTATRSTGENDGYADNLSFLLTVIIGFGDLNLDGVINTADWQQFRAGQANNMTGFTAAQALSAGDLNGDFLNNHADFVLFKSAYDAANGAGAFAAMLASVPEPTTAMLAALPLCGLTGRVRRYRWRG
jgi:hypothetical protein